jgi:hypothetical protein
VNDKPLPVFVEVSVNRKPLGILSFNEQNNKFSAKSFTEFLNKGKNTLTFYFLNDNLDGSDDLTDQNVDFIFSGFSYRKIAAGEEERSDFLPSSDFIHPDVPGSFVLPDDTKKLNPFWELNGNGKMLIEKVQDKLNLHCIIPYDSKSLTIASQPVTAVPNKILYCSVRMKSENMANHSANVMFVYIDAGNKMLSRVWTHPTGITGDSPWFRFPCLRPVPEGAQYVIIVINVYPNGNRPGRASENLWISDFKFLPQNM